MAYTRAMHYSHLEGMLRLAERMIGQCRESAGAVGGTDEIRRALDDVRDVLRKSTETACFLAMEEARRTT